MTVLPLEYYRHHDVLLISQELLGKMLFTCIDGELTGGMIIETEAYHGPEDRASHAFNNRKTKRNASMFEQGGISYVYQCYGIHALFNIVTNDKDIPHAILVRAIKPLIGIDVMLQRRHREKVDKRLAGGPGTLTEALGITLKHNGIPLDSKVIWIEDHHIKIKPSEIVAGPRVGVDYAGDDALLPWRFRLL